ncbi:hypothetical protein Dimus_013250 [Dionaea muscipula]
MMTDGEEVMGSSPAVVDDGSGRVRRQAVVVSFPVVGYAVGAGCGMSWWWLTPVVSSPLGGSCPPSRGDEAGSGRRLLLLSASIDEQQGVMGGAAGVDGYRWRRLQMKKDGGKRLWV